MKVNNRYSGVWNHWKVYVFLFIGSSGLAQEGQADVMRIDMMPNLPAPYNVREWKSVALSYDTFVYDATRSGQYLPLISIQSSGVNYPGNATFGMHSYVGTGSPNAGEAINILPSLVGATLNGVDKRDQYGRDWILMSQDYFNGANGEYLYLNNRGGHSGSDWWYDVMPNIYFYQLYDLYGSVGDADAQFIHIADRFLEAVQVMGGSATPWSAANMDYRAWNFLEMEPNADGVHEPEAAGGFAWILYNAYAQTGDEKYLKGAEWSIEFLTGLNSNPSYELQLPYGVSVAARMNAELHTRYDMDKLVSWVFDRGPLRGWGTIVGKWGGLDVSGLVGEANDQGNDYAFQMNGVQQAAALVPMVRYDKRYSRAIAKWFLNLVNATRLMYPRFLPATYQDASAWSDVYDPQAVVGYEALREKVNGISPFSTGDALGGGWAATNLALYGTSSIGYLGALFTKTDQDKILLIDLLKTDFYHDAAYPSYLLFNPFGEDKAVTLDVGPAPVDIYNALTESFVMSNVTGNITITIPADEAMSLVYAPAGGTISYRESALLIDNVVVDYDQHAQPYNHAPRIKAVATEAPQIETGDTTRVFGTAVDPEDDGLEYFWEATGGVLTGDGPEVDWIAPLDTGHYTITLIVKDPSGNADTSAYSVAVVFEINVPPVIDRIETDRQYLEPGGQMLLTCIAGDENNDPLTFTWQSQQGSISGTGSAVTWTSPSIEGIYTVRVTVADDKGAEVMAETKILVKVFPPGTGNLVAHYPFDGDALDVSGNELHGAVFGAKLDDDRFGNPLSAYAFDGINDHISVASSAILNFTSGITVTCWITPSLLPDRESFIVSHGSWQNRWKISVTPDRHVRWTVKTATGAVRDLDSRKQIEADETYHLAASYDGELLLLYLNGQLENIGTLTGAINTTSIGLEIGQMLPDNQAYNFRGVIDDIRIYDYALNPDSIAQAVLSHLSTDAFYGNLTIYPNPARDILVVDLMGGSTLPELTGYAIFDRRGIIVDSKRVRQGQNQLIVDTSGLSAGIYYLQLQARRGSRSVPFAKLE